MATARAPEDSSTEGRVASAAGSRPAGSPAGSRERGRARHPDMSGFVERDGVRVFYEVFGSGETTLLMLPTWSIVHARVWKLQIADLARRHRVITFDPRGNGLSDRPATAQAYAESEFAADALAVLDATGTHRAVLVTLSMGAQRGLLLASDHPERVAGAVFIGPALALEPSIPGRAPANSFMDEPDSDEGWAKYNAHSWRRDYRGFLEFFFSQCFSEAHSTKPTDDSVGWGLETDPETLILTELAPGIGDREATLARIARVRCPVLVIHGREDGIRPHADGEELARASGARLITIEGGGHIPNARDPVRVNLAIRDFVEAPATTTTTTTWTHALRRRRRALYISSPIGLGHAMRDAAIADELRGLCPDLEIDWLAQHPVTAVLESRGERIHPSSAELASESAHIAAESAGHDLNAFQAIRRMDEILLANFMVFHDAVATGEYDLVIGDEAWDIDHYLHENPELKRTAFAWMTDFVGWLPMPDGGDREAFLTADYNVEMIEHVERFPRLRDRAIFVGNPDDVVPDDFGPGLPAIRDWTERHFSFSGYVTGFDPAPLVDGREALRRELGYGPDERVVVVTVGGSGVGEALLRRVLDAYPDAARRVNGLRMIAVAGPRIDPDSIRAPAGVEVRPFVPDLYRHLVACDLAVVQGGLTTTMELAAAGRPFLYFPLANHFEQRRHVRHRLDRYGAGRFMEFDDALADVLGAAIAEEIGRPVTSLPIEADGAARAAAMIAELL
jgi:pimeloyl-ACP methyl ester carboxylesterase